MNLYRNFSRGRNHGQYLKKYHTQNTKHSLRFQPQNAKNIYYDYTLCKIEASIIKMLINTSPLVETTGNI